MASVGEQAVVCNATNMCENITQPRDVIGSTPNDVIDSTHNANIDQSNPILVNLNEQIRVLLEEETSSIVSESCHCHCDEPGSEGQDSGRDINANETGALKMMLEDKIRAFLDLELIHEQYHRQWVEFNTQMWQYRNLQQPRDIHNNHVTDLLHHVTTIDQSEAATCLSLDSLDIDGVYRDGGDALFNTATCTDRHQKELYLTEDELDCQHEFLLDKKAAIWNRFMELEHSLRSQDDEDIVPLRAAHAHTDLSRMADLTDGDSDVSDLETDEEMAYDPDEHGRNLHRCRNSLDLSEIYSQYVYGDSIASAVKVEFSETAAATTSTTTTTTTTTTTPSTGVETQHDTNKPYTNFASDTDMTTGCNQCDMSPVYQMNTGRIQCDMTPVTDAYRDWAADRVDLGKKLSEATAISGSDRDGPEGDQQAAPVAILKDVSSLQLKRSSSSRLSESAVSPQTSSDNDVMKKSSSTVNHAGDQLIQANSYTGNISTHSSSFSKLRKRFSGLMSRTMRVKSITRTTTSGSTKRSSDL